ncbi:MAG: phospholipase D-like domain-containing protein [Haloarculaceae archaeon]
MPSPRTLALVALLVLGAVATPAATGTTPRAEDARIVAAYPNPVADGDRGEFVVLDVPSDTHLGGLTLADGEDRAQLPDRTVEGRVVLTTTPKRVPNGTDGRVLAVEGFPSLANAGETLVLRRGDRTVATVRYADAPEGELRRWPGGWRPLGTTDFPVRHTDGGQATAFVLPDAPEIPVETLESADERVLLAGYTFTDDRVRRALVTAQRRGVEVRVLVDDAPVGGLPRAMARELDRLADAGVEVRVVGGPHARYDFHHAKYAVADDTALVMTENWKPAGTGGNSSRGWGVRLRDGGTVRALAATFRADFEGREARRWPAFRRGRHFEPGDRSNATYPTRFDPERVEVRNTSVLVAPENAEEAVVERLAAAEESISVVQVSLGGAGGPFATALLRAARRGVRVRILLSGAWYAHEENARLAEALNERAKSRDLPLSVRLADPDGRFRKVHAKGAIVDGETVLVGSLNWNAHAARENREVLLALRGPEVADYYGRVFEADWSAGRGPDLPVGLLVAVAFAALVAVVVARRVRFDEDRGEQGVWGW